MEQKAVAESVKAKHWRRMASVGATRCYSHQSVSYRFPVVLPETLQASSWVTLFVRVYLSSSELVRH